MSNKEAVVCPFFKEINELTCIQLQEFHRDQRRHSVEQLLVLLHPLPRSRRSRWSACRGFRWAAVG